jgi:AcrR family transcriptional regulator
VTLARRPSPLRAGAPPRASDLVIAAHQDRSREAERRLVRSLTALLASRPYERISVPDIAAEAGVAVGSVYRRFPSKERLLFHAANELARVVLLPDLERTARREQWERLNGRDVLGRYLRFVARAFRRHRPLLRAVSVVSRLDLDRDLTRAVTVANGIAHSRIRELLLARRSEINHARAEGAIDLGILLASAALREVVLFGQPVSSLGRRGSLGSLADEVSDAIWAYLQGSPGRGAR